MTVVNSFLLNAPGSYIVQVAAGSDKIIINSTTLVEDVFGDNIDMGAFMEAIIQSQTVTPVGIVPVGTFNLNSVITLPNPTFVERILSIATNTSVPVAQGATVAVVTPPANNTNALTLKGIGGDTGLVMNQTQPFILTLDPTQNTFVLNSSPGTTIVQVTYM